MRNRLSGASIETHFRLIYIDLYNNYSGKILGHVSYIPLCHPKNEAKSSRSSHLGVPHPSSLGLAGPAIGLRMGLRPGFREDLLVTPCSFTSK